MGAAWKSELEKAVTEIEYTIQSRYDSEIPEPSKDENETSIFQYGKVIYGIIVLVFLFSMWFKIPGNLKEQMDKINLIDFHTMQTLYNVTYPQDKAKITEGNEFIQKWKNQVEYEQSQQ